MSCRGEVKSFNAKAGWGFISLDGVDVFLHVKDCGPTFRPKQGAEVSFDTADNPKQAGQKVAKNVKALRVGACEGVVKSFVDKKGYGFISHDDGDVFLHINDCVDGRPAPGDQVNFDVEESDKTPGQMIAKRVTGCTKMLDQDDGKGKGKDDGKGGKGDKGGKGKFDDGCKGGGGYGPAPGWGGPPPPMYGGYDPYAPPVARFCPYTGRPLEQAFDQFTGRPLAEKGGWGGPPMDYGYAKGGYGAPAPYGYDKGFDKGFDKGPYGKGGGKGGFMDKGKGGKGGGNGGGRAQGTGQYTGSVKSFVEEKGYGFIIHQGEGDVFFHGKDMVDGSVPDRGDILRYDIEDNPGKPGTLKATNVTGGSKGKGQGKGKDYGGKGKY